MYIHKIQISNIRSIGNLEWEIEAGQEAGWHVVIGDNGSGKSTLLRAIALALIGPTEAAALRQDWNIWIRRGGDEGSVRLEVTHDEAVDKFSRRGKVNKPKHLPVGITVQRLESVTRIEKSANLNPDPDRHIWGDGSGWFSASFGPFRRFTGGDKDYEKMFYSNPNVAAHLSVFSESVALTECIRWLQELQFRKLERRVDSYLLDYIVDFVNQENFLPHTTRVKEISSEGVSFTDGNGNIIPVEDLSDGYRSVLSMSFELIRQLSRIYGYDGVFDSKDTSKVISPGVVLIDEVDAHLHPTWQRRIGLWFRRHFPNIQFIVTTHSPFICQAATEGSVYRLPLPGTDESGGMVTGIDLDRLLYGNVLDAYGTEVFGLSMTRSDESRKKLQRLADLNRKELNDELTEEELEEQEQLRAILPTSAHHT